MLYIHVHAYTCSRGVGEVLLLKVYISAPVAEPPVHLVLYWPGLTYLVSSCRSTAVCTIWVHVRRCSFPQTRYLHVHACQVAFPSLASRSPDGWSSPLVAILRIASLSPESNFPQVPAKVPDPKPLNPAKHELGSVWQCQCWPRRHQAERRVLESGTMSSHDMLSGLAKHPSGESIGS